MIAPESVEEVFAAIEQSKEKATAFCTNFFPAKSKLEAWIEQKTLKVQSSPETTFFLRRDRDFWHLYFCARDPDALGASLKKLAELKTERVVLDVLGKREELAALLPALTAAGLQPYKELVRMARGAATQEEFAQFPDEFKARPSVAERGDGQAVLALIESAFDPYAKQIPSLDEIESAIEACQILIVRQGQDPAGLLFFETRGVTSTLRFWAMARKFRDLHLGSTLMRHYLISQAVVRRFVLWVNADNEDALRKYRHYHYATDGVVDCVLANEWILDESPFRNSPRDSSRV